jgi:cobalt-zinc-cadmium efflux system outer membrane protein
MVPIFNQGQPRIARSEAALRRAERTLEAKAIEIRSTVRKLQAQMDSKRQIARYYQSELLPERIAILNAMLLQHNAMISGAFDLFIAKRDGADAERNYVEAARDYWIARPTRATCRRKSRTAPTAEWKISIGFKSDRERKSVRKK